MRGKCPKVLLVGPRLSEAREFRGRLRESGCACHAVTSVEEAKRRIASHRYDVVLSETGLGLSSLIEELARAGSSLFFCIPVRIGWHWTPFLRSGKNCFGEPLLRSTGLVRLLDTFAKGTAEEARALEMAPLPGELRRRPGAPKAFFEKRQKPA